MNKLLKTVSIITIVLIVGALAIFTVASAQEPEGPGRSPGGNRGGRGFGPPHGLMQNEDLRAQMQAALAEALGLSVEALETAQAEGQTLKELAEAQSVEPAEIREAMEAVRQEAIDQAIEDGLLTQEEADRLGQGGPKREFGHRGGPAQGFIFDEEFRTQIEAAVAEALGLSVEELEAAKADGRSLQEVASAQGVEMTDIRAAVQAVHQAALDQAVADGLLTQEEADQIEEHMTEKADSFGTGPGFRGPRRDSRPFDRQFRENGQ